MKDFFVTGNNNTRTCPNLASLVESESGIRLVEVEVNGLVEDKLHKTQIDITFVSK